jgi:hypothetical protein
MQIILKVLISLRNQVSELSLMIEMERLDTGFEAETKNSLYDNSVIRKKESGSFLRKHKEGDQGSLALSEFIDKIASEIKNKV